MSLNITEFPQRIIDNNPNFVSRWSAVNHSITFKTQRQDYAVVLDYDFNINTLAFYSSPVLLDFPLPGDKIYIESSNISDTFVLAAFIPPNGFIMEPGPVQSPLIGTSGFANFLSRKNYFTLTNVYGINDNNQYDLIGQSRNKQDSTGRGSVDVSSFLKNIVGYEDKFNYDVINQRDTSLGSPYNITYSENWQGYEGAFSGLSNTILRFAVNSAKQIQEIYGQNMGEYVPFWIDLSTQVPESKFLSDFKEPTYFPNFPFSLSFIYSEYLVAIQTIKAEETFGVNSNVIQPTFYNSLFNNEAQEVNRLMISENYSTFEVCTEVWLETEGVQDCTPYVQPGYVLFGYAEEICDLPYVGPPADDSQNLN